MNKRFSYIAVLIISLCVSAFGQDTSSSTLEERRAEVKQQAVKYLRESVSEVYTLRTNENRISFSSELANLMWLYDEPEARKMFSRVADNYVQLLSENNARLDALGGMQDESDIYMGPGDGRDERRMTIRKIYKARDVREIVALAIAEHDPQLAYDFVVRTTTIVTDQMLAENFKDQNDELESQILERMSIQKVENSLSYARKALKRGFKREFVAVAQKIYVKNPEEAITFGKELVDKLRSEATNDSESAENVFSVLEAGSVEMADAKPGAKPLFEKSDMADLAQMFAQNLLRTDELETYRINEYIEVINKYHPSLSNQVKAKFVKDDNDNDSPKREMPRGIPDSIVGEGDSPELTPAQAAAQARLEEQRALMQELAEGKEKTMSREEKSEFIQRARKIVREIEIPTMKVMALSALATRVKHLGDADLAKEIMREGETLLNPDPKNFVDFMLLWAVASGYSAVDPAESFPLIEDAIFRLNDTIEAFVKVAEFIDVNGEIVIDGEFQVGVFGGSMIRSVLAVANQSGDVIGNLSMEDFERTKGLAEKFQKPEIRILARFIVLRSVLENDKSNDLGLIK